MCALLSNFMLTYQDSEGQVRRCEAARHKELVSVWYTHIVSPNICDRLHLCCTDFAWTEVCYLFHPGFGVICATED